MKRFVLVILIISFSELVWGQIKLEIVYPRVNAEGPTIVMERVDSNFVFGNVDPYDCSVNINGIEAKVYLNGAFLAFVPVDKDKKYFKIEAKYGELTTVKNLPFVFPGISSTPNLSAVLPTVLEITHPNAVIRYSANQGVYYLFPAKGARVYADSTVGNYYRIKLQYNQYVWIDQKFVTPRADLPVPSSVRVYVIKAYETDAGVEITIPGANFPLHKVALDNDPRHLDLYLYNIESHLDRIENHTDIIRDIRWEQITQEMLQLHVIMDKTLIWGYNCEIDSSGNFHLFMRKAPDLKLANLRIALDAGHGGNDNGALGPTGLKEKEVNFDIALRLALLLEDKNALIYLTRTSDEFCDVYTRIDNAVEWGADILISIHNNALPDGVNPFNYRGYGVYYYHPQAIELARAIQGGLRKHIELPDNGIYYANLAIPRATELPAVLVETAYIIHPEDEMLLQEDEFRQRLAEAIFQGIIDYVERLKNLVN